MPRNRTRKKGGSKPPDYHIRGKTGKLHRRTVGRNKNNPGFIKNDKNLIIKRALVILENDEYLKERYRNDITNIYNNIRLSISKKNSVNKNQQNDSPDLIIRRALGILENDEVLKDKYKPRINILYKFKLYNLEEENSEEENSGPRMRTREDILGHYPSRFYDESRPPMGPIHTERGRYINGTFYPDVFFQNRWVRSVDNHGSPLVGFDRYGRPYPLGTRM